MRSLTLKPQLKLRSPRGLASSWETCPLGFGFPHPVILWSQEFSISEVVAPSLGSLGERSHNLCRYPTKFDMIQALESYNFLLVMTGRTSLDSHQFNSLADANLTNQQRLQQAQELLYKYLKNLVNNYPPETVLQEFKNLFICGDSTIAPEGLQALYKIILNNDEEEFKNTFKRACYILVNNWSSQRKTNYIQELIQILADVAETPSPLSPSLKRLRAWVVTFINGEDYQELKLFASPHANHGYWSYRYTSYLLVPQYLNSQNPKEQRELAKKLSERLKQKYKFDLAMYTARCNSPVFQDKEHSNPTKLGDGVIRLIKKVLSKNTLFDYHNQAHLFIQQTRELNYKEFKLQLQDYLCFYFANESFLKALKARLGEKLDNLYESHHQDSLNVDLLLRTSRRLVEWLTTEDGKEPSYLFILLTTQGNTLTLALILLKIILICQYVRTHLEVCIAKLIRYYEQYPEKECQWVINFLEIFNVVFAIYTENVQYNLVKVEGKHVADRDAYRVFSQLKGAYLRGNDLSNSNLRNSDLSAADLREANLCRTDLTQADLSLAKLGRANMSSAILNEAELIAADLSNANLSNASLIATKLRHADLQQAILTGAILSRASLNTSALNGADLRDADLQYADLSNADLSNANLSGANLQYADLSNTNLSGANLGGANLQYTNLSNANLSGTNLAKVNLNRANLEHADLCDAELRSAFLRHVRLSYAKLRGANLSHIDLSHAELSGGDLRDSNLSDALLRHVNLTGADLRHADLRGANLFSTNLGCANTEGTQFGDNPEFYELETI